MTGPSTGEAWAAIEETEDFQRLVAERRRAVSGPLAFVALWFGAYVLFYAFGQDLLSEEIGSGVTVALVFSLSQFVVVGLVTWRFLVASSRVLDPLSERVARAASATDASTKA